MKLRKLVNENTEDQAQKLTREQRKDVIAAVSKFNEYGKSVYRESDIKELVDTLKELSTNASSLAVTEAGDWFDAISVKRDMKEVNTAVDMFSKTANEISTLQQRLESVFEDIGHKLGKYYEIAEAVDHIDDEEADTKYKDLKDKDIDNDGDEDESDEYLHHKLGTTAKKTEEIKLESLVNEGFATWKMQFAPMVLSGVKLDPKKVYTVKARSTVEAIKKASKAAGLSGNDWMATQTHKLEKIG
tara:strand:+ start:591 stop:1322 length:732 start_codon:yes stop_codon:yes gene_type:complete